MGHGRVLHSWLRRLEPGQNLPLFCGLWHDRGRKAHTERKKYKYWFDLFNEYTFIDVSTNQTYLICWNYWTFFFHRFTLEIPNNVIHDNLFSVWQQEVTGPNCLREDELCVTLITVLSPIKHRVCFLLPDYTTVVECMLHQNRRHTIKMKKKYTLSNVHSLYWYLLSHHITSFLILKHNYAVISTLQTGEREHPILNASTRCKDRIMMAAQLNW